MYGKCFFFFVYLLWYLEGSQYFSIFPFFGFDLSLVLCCLMSLIYLLLDCILLAVWVVGIVAFLFHFYFVVTCIILGHQDNIINSKVLSYRYLYTDITL